MWKVNWVLPYDGENDDVSFDQSIWVEDMCVSVIGNKVMLRCTRTHYKEGHRLCLRDDVS